MATLGMMFGIGVSDGNVSVSEAIGVKVSHASRPPDGCVHRTRCVGHERRDAGGAVGVDRRRRREDDAGRSVGRRLHDQRRAAGRQHRRRRRRGAGDADVGACSIASCRDNPIAGTGIIQRVGTSSTRAGDRRHLPRRVRRQGRRARHARRHAIRRSSCCFTAAASMGRRCDRRLVALRLARARLLGRRAARSPRAVRRRSCGCRPACGRRATRSTSASSRRSRPTRARSRSICASTRRPSLVWLNATELTIDGAEVRAGGASQPARVVPGGEDYVGFAAGDAARQGRGAAGRALLRQARRREEPRPLSRRRRQPAPTIGTPTPSSSRPTRAAPSPASTSRPTRCRGS